MFYLTNTICLTPNSRISHSSSMTGVTKAVVCVILSVEWSEAP